MRHRLLLGIFLFVFLFATAQTTQWTELRRDDLHFTIDFPGPLLPPEFDSHPLQPQFAAVHSWPSAGTHEAIRCVVYELADTTDSDAELLTLTRDLMLRAGSHGEQCTLDSEFPTSLNGFPGRAFTYHDSQWRYRGKIYVVRAYGKLYATVVTTYPDQPFSADAEQFEDSLRLIPTE